MDVVVTVPQREWLIWLAEGDLPGEPSTGEWAIYIGRGTGRKPSPPTNLHPGDRVYILAHGLIRGYAPLVRIQETAFGYGLVRAGGAVVTTVLDTDRHPMWVRPFQGVRYRWWVPSDEGPFPDDDWQTRGLKLTDQALVRRMIAARKRGPHVRTWLSEKALNRVLGPAPSWERFLQGMPA
jgi:hypothetical protein